LAAQACYNPKEAIGVWQRMAAAGKSNPPEFLSTHPSHHSRMENLQVLQSKAEAVRQDNNCNDTSGYLSDMFSKIAIFNS
jgi:predicted Zn-dependent protease